MRPGIDYIGVGCGAVIFDRDGKIFLTLRGPHSKNERGKWEIPGGGVEFGETVAEAVRREVREEIGVELEVVELLDVVDHIIAEENQHWVSPVLICKIKSGTPQNREPHKHERIGWFSIEEMQKMPLSLATESNLRALRRKFPGGIPDNYKTL